MKPALACAIFLLSIFLGAACAWAHFGMIIPSSSTVMDRAAGDIELEISFSHPFAGQGMNMRLPKKFGVWRDGEYTDLLSALTPEKIMDAAAFKASFQLTLPGVYAFAVEPEPYFEAAEDRFIIHYAKTVVGAFGAEEGWEKPLGLPVEIVPKLRPFANYAGNVFVGQVLFNGKPAPNALVEVEAYNRSGLRRAPNAYFETQTIFCDENGIFAFGIPWPGWWGFAALCDSETRLPHENGEKAAELGGILWVEFSQPAHAAEAQAKNRAGSLWQE